MGFLSVFNVFIIIVSVTSTHMMMDQDTYEDGVFNCSNSITLDDTQRPLPYPPATLYQGRAKVQHVYITHTRTTLPGRWWLGFWLYQAGKNVGGIELLGGGGKEDQVGFRCEVGRDSDYLPVPWSTASHRLTSPRHLTLQISDADVLKIFEGMDGEKNLFKQHKCNDVFPVDDLVKVWCYYGDCGEIQQCAMIATETTTTPEPTTPEPTTPEPTTPEPTTRDQTVVWILVAVLVAAVIGGVVVALHYRRRAIRAEQALASLRTQTRQAQAQAQQGGGDEEGIYLQPRSYPQHDFPPTPTIPRVQVSPAAQQATEEDEESHIYDEPFSY